MFHPGGSLGANLAHVRDVMHTGDRLPLAPLGTLMSEALLLISQKGFGCLGIIDAERRRSVGIITDGDLRRHLSGDIFDAAGRGRDDARPEDHRAPTRWSPRRWRSLNSASITALLVVRGEKAGRHRPHARSPEDRRRLT